MQPGEIEAIRRDLAALLGHRNVSVGASDRALYSRDCWPKAVLWARRGELRYPPDVVAWPGSTDDVARLIRYARERHLPLTPFGAGSSVVAGAMPMRAGISVDLKRLRRVTHLDLATRRATAQAGIVGQRLEDELESHGATMGHFPASLYCSTLGGWIAARSAGQLSSHYGKIEDMILGLTAVAGNGEIIRTGPERRPGPDLVQLLTGSEGTLAIVTEATFAIHPQPTTKAMGAFRMKSTDAGLAAMRLLFRAGLRPHVLRLYDPIDSQFQSDGDGAGESSLPGPVRSAFGALRSRSLGYALSAPGMINRAFELLSPRSLLILSFEGDHQAQVEDDLRAAVDIVRDQGGTEIGEEPVRRWYRRRHHTPYRQSAIFSGRAWVDTLEICTTWDRVMTVQAAVRRAVWGDAVVLCHFSHAYLEGCSLGLSFLGPATTVEKGEDGYDRVWRAGMRAALDAGATLSHHHGVGAAMARFLPDELGDSGMRMLRALKATFDPDGILNPGKLLA